MMINYSGILNYKKQQQKSGVYVEGRFGEENEIFSIIGNDFVRSLSFSFQIAVNRRVSVSNWWNGDIVIFQKLQPSERYELFIHAKLNRVSILEIKTVNCCWSVFLAKIGTEYVLWLYFSVIQQFRNEIVT